MAEAPARTHRGRRIRRISPLPVHPAGQIPARAAHKASVDRPSAPAPFSASPARIRTLKKRPSTNLIRRRNIRIGISFTIQPQTAGAFSWGRGSLSAFPVVASGSPSAHPALTDKLGDYSNPDSANLQAASVSRAAASRAVSASRAAASVSRIRPISSRNSRTNNLITFNRTNRTYSVPHSCVLKHSEMLPQPWKSGPSEPALSEAEGAA